MLIEQALFLRPGSAAMLFMTCVGTRSGPEGLASLLIHAGRMAWLGYMLISMDRDDDEEHLVDYLCNFSVPDKFLKS